MKLFDKITKDLNMNKFLVLHDKIYIKTIVGLGTLWLFLAGTIWSFDFDKISQLLILNQTMIQILRMQALVVATSICWSALVIINLCFYKKWKKIDELSLEEQKIFNEYFKVPSFYEKQGVQVFRSA